MNYFIHTSHLSTEKFELIVKIERENDKQETELLPDYAQNDSEMSFVPERNDRPC